MKATIRTQSQAWAMLADLKAPMVDELKAMSADRLRDIARYLAWIADDRDAQAEAALDAAEAVKKP